MSILTSLIVILFLIGLSFLITKRMHEKFNRVSIKRGILNGLTIGIIHIAFSCVVSVLSNGEGFVTYWETHEAINNISFDAIKITAICLAALVPVILCRFKSGDEFAEYVVAAFFTTCMVYVFELIVIYIAVFVSVQLDAEIKMPLNSWDSMFLALIYFPVGNLIGLAISAGINFVLNKTQRKDED